MLNESFPGLHTVKYKKYKNIGKYKNTKILSVRVRVKILGVWG